MRAHDLLAPIRVGRPHGPKAHDGTIRTERVDEMWGTDLTSILTGEGQASIFVTVDHCSTECVGIHAARRATRFEALEPLRQGAHGMTAPEYRERFGLKPDYPMTAPGYAAQRSELALRTGLARNAAPAAPDAAPRKRRL